MPGGAGKPKRACPGCKWYKYEGNSKGRRPPRDLRRDEPLDVMPSEGYVTPFVRQCESCGAWETATVHNGEYLCDKCLSFDVWVEEKYDDPGRSIEDDVVKKLAEQLGL